ncbi:MAG: HEAT repeat domain-containing protein [Anaerolineae bacterium]|nr:HEAT repeat domain-containing protein [Anaerolineae bacterium]
MNADKRVVAYHIGRLKDKRVEVRLASIAELAELGDAGALNALETVYRSDEDAAVRHAAQQAGRVIYAKQRALAEGK